MSKDKAFGEGGAVFGIEAEEEKVESPKEKIQGQGEKPEELENKIQELQKTAAERVAEAQDGLNKLMAQTEGWDAEDQPEYKRLMRKTISGYLQKAIGNVSKRDGLALVQGGYYEEMLQVFDTIERRIARINVLDEDRNPRNQAIMMALANGALTAKGELTFAGAGKAGSGYPVRTWEDIVRRENI